MRNPDRLRTSRLWILLFPVHQFSGRVVFSPVNTLFSGDNLMVLQEHVAAESVDLVYLDPPFNTSRTHNTGIRSSGKGKRSAPVAAFEDSWTWGAQSEGELRRLRRTCPRLARLLTSLRGALGDGAMAAWLVALAVRLVELHRVLKPSGSLYLHCDPATSPYARVVLDALFGTDRFLNEIIWKRTSAHNSAHRYGPSHDTLLFYSKSATFTWNPQRGPYDDRYLASFFTHIDDKGRWRRTDLTGPGLRKGTSGKPWKGYDPSTRNRHWQPPSYFYDKYRELTGGDLSQYELLKRLDRLEEVGLIHRPAKPGGMPQGKRWLQDAPGALLQDVWDDVKVVHNLAAERQGYPTQKPLALLERIVRASSNEGDLVLDPYCGSGTTLIAAQSLGRSWIGIDESRVAIALVKRRLETAKPVVAWEVRTSDASPVSGPARQHVVVVPKW
jgi:DNA modification methylase